jgi:hypothetical protein
MGMDRRSRLPVMEGLVGIVALLSVFGFPTAVVYLRARHRERMRALEVGADARRVAELEAARSDLETRVRTLETIVTSGDRDLEVRLRRLAEAVASPAPARLPARQG